ncbi:MAG: DUF3343 domain-containing protein [Xylanivirga thermophila]|jgi:hypothetical protein|uniref:DUF3343 domain-containing protein n=1 Tax=Xylanivirga thermophila TaxID=2496273 RepID=UPI0039F5AEC7
MPYNETFDIVAFRSRSHALKFCQTLNQEGCAARIISTPKEIALGCGLSVRFEPYVTPRAIEIYKRFNLPIIGFYHIERMGSITNIKRIHHESTF